MKKAGRKRLIQFIVLTLLVFISAKMLLAGVNRLSTKPVFLQQGVLSVDAMDGSLHVLQGTLQQKDTQEFTVRTKHTLGIVVHNLAYPAQLMVNGELEAIGSHAYHVLTVDAGETSVKLSGDGVQQTVFYVAQASTMRRYLELRLIINACMFFLHMLVFLACLVYLIAGKHKKIAGALLLFVLSSMIKGINLGELPFLSVALGMNLSIFSTVDGITTALNNILPIYILLLLFEIRLRKVYLWLLFTFVIPLAVLSQDPFSRALVWQNVIGIAILALTFTLIGYGYVKGKKAALPIMILRTVLFVLTTTYVAAVRNGAPVSNLVFFCNYAYLGATIYFIGIFAVVVVYYLRFNQALAAKKIEYERVMLLKGLGHDLKHPVLTAKLNSQFLLAMDLNAEARESVEISLKALGRLDTMIENINDYFNLRNLQSKQEPLSLREALRSIEEKHKKQAEYTLVVRYAEEDCMICINPVSFDRIIDNLTDNAFRYSNAEKTVLISYAVSESKVLLFVEDNGRGLGEQETDKVFELFYRGEENRTVEGLGIGLSVVKQLVESAGGTISVQSQKGRGTKFIICLPVAGTTN